MKRVLVCVDGSEASGRALEMAVEFARATGVQVTVAHVVAPLMVPVDGYPTTIVEPGATVQLERQAREFGELVASRTAQHARELGGQADSRVLFGEPAKALVEEAEAHDYGLVAIGSRGHNALKRALLGSTSDRVVHTCRRPVLVVH